MTFFSPWSQRLLLPKGLNQFFEKRGLQSKLLIAFSLQLLKADSDLFSCLFCHSFFRLLLPCYLTFWSSFMLDSLSFSVFGVSFFVSISSVFTVFVDMSSCFWHSYMSLSIMSISQSFPLFYSLFKSMYIFWFVSIVVLYIVHSINDILESRFLMILMKY